MKNNILVFDIWADYGHFRKFYTTTSPLTFYIPPPTALFGLISAILGIDKNEYWKYFNKKDLISIKILKKISKIMFSENLINTKGKNYILVKKSGHSPRTQIRFELLKNPIYRIYFTHPETELYNRFRSFLKQHKSVYTPCLGLSELIANFKFIAEYSYENITNNQNLIEINSVLKYNKNIEIEIEEGKEYLKVNLPIQMNTERIVTEYNTLLIERTGKSIKTKIKTYQKLSNGENITLL